jgi:hypothetical protein
MGNYIFTYIRSRDGYRVDLPGKFLNGAKKEPVSIPLEDGDVASLTNTPWYDQYSVSGKEGGVYGNIREVTFEEDAVYSVFFFRKVRQPYMMAIRQAR